MSCSFIREPTVTVIYVYVASNALYKRLGMKFVKMYLARKAGYPHRLVIACNGRNSIQDSTRNLFETIADKDFYRHDNTGWDLGAYQAVAQIDRSDLLVFMGSSCIPTRSGWLRRIMDSFELHGDGLYGSMHHNGNSFASISPHIRTTGFWMPRVLFNAYPIKVRMLSQRYAFEHGQTCLTTWMVRNGFPVYAVTWDGEWDFPQWKNVTNGYHQGKQSGLIFRDRLTEPPYYNG